MPHGAHPLSGAMVVLVQVSSMKTSREGSIRKQLKMKVSLRRKIPGDVLERPLVRDPIGDDALPAFGSREGFCRMSHRRLGHVR
jgi:hypothetical protein